MCAFLVKVQETQCIAPRMVYMPSGHGVDDSRTNSMSRSRTSSEQNCLGWALCALHLPEVVCLGGYLTLHVFFFCSLRHVSQTLHAAYT